jgi:DNA-binding transcriptional regulator YhcF (GntR family)
VFQIVAIPFDAFQALPCAKTRWLLTCFSRYVDKAGKAFPSLRRLARDARMSLASVSRYMAAMERLGVFQRERKPGGRYHYILAEAYRPRWPGRPKSAVSPAERGVSQAATQQVKSKKQFKKERFDGLPEDRTPWKHRLMYWRDSGGKFWNPLWGPKPTEPNCYAPPILLRTILTTSG